MSTSRKPRGDSVLKTLPPERQAAIIEYLLEHTQPETREWLAADGVKTSNASLSEFYSWYQLRKQFSAVEQDTLTVIDLLRRKRPDLDKSELDDYAAEYFQLRALKLDDPETYLQWSTARSNARLKERALALEERRVKLLEEKAAKADQAEQIEGSTLSEAEKADRIRAIFKR